MPIRLNVDDKNLIQSAQAGDAESFGILYEKYAGSIYKYLFVHLGNVEDAEDITVEVFLRAWNALPGYDQRGYPFRAFLFRIARNLLVDQYRQHRTVSELDERFKDENLIDLEQAAVEQVEDELIRKSLREIHPDYRHVLMLRFFGGLSLLEIAKVMKRSENAVRVLQHRALKALRKLVTVEGKK